MQAVKIGFDTVLIHRIEKSLKRWGEGFVDRLFTLNEQIYCNSGKGNVRASRYAVRYAAKEAFVKAWDLFYWDGPPPLTGICFSSIEVILDRWGRPSIQLLGKVERTFAELGFSIQSVSLSHDQTNACAVVAVGLKG